LWRNHRSHSLLVRQPGQVLPRAASRYAHLETIIYHEEFADRVSTADAAAGGRGGQTVKIDAKDAEYTHKLVGSPWAGWFSAKPMFDLIHKETNGDYLE
jgi:hypothetical protein